MLCTHRMNLLRTMGARGAACDPQGNLVFSGVPWLDLSVTMLIAFALLTAATRITERQDL